MKTDYEILDELKKHKWVMFDPWNGQETLDALSFIRAIQSDARESALKEAAEICQSWKENMASLKTHEFVCDRVRERILTAAAKVEKGETV